jgi:hypothetical protein
MEQAALIAEEYAHEAYELGYIYQAGDVLTTYSVSFVDAKYAEGVSPVNAPSWFVLFEALEEGREAISIPEGDTQEGFLAQVQSFMEGSPAYYSVSPGQNSKGEPAIIISYTIQYHVVVELNALTGGFIMAVHENQYYSFNPVDAFYSDDVKPGLLQEGAESSNSHG